MNLSQLLVTVAALGLLLCTSCQSGKIAYGNSYYFKATPRPAGPAPDLHASTAPAVVSLVPNGPARMTTPSPSPTARVASPTWSRREARQARRTQRRAVRKQLRQWLQTPPRESDAQATQRLEGLARAGVITGAGGLVMLLIGVLAGVPFLTGLGGIILAIAVVLILIDVL